MPIQTIQTLTAPFRNALNTCLDYGVSAVEHLRWASTWSLEQKQELVKAGMHTAPAATMGAGAAVSKPAELIFLGQNLNTWVVVASLFFIFMQIAFLAWKWRRQSNIDKERREQGLPLESLEK